MRFLSARLRRDLIGELRFTAQEAQASRDGIDVASLELAGADLAAMDVLRTGAGMDFLARLDRGRGLGNAARDAFAGSAGAIVLRAASVDRAALLDAGRGLMRLWLEATRHRLAIHPWGSPFLFQRLLEDGTSLEGWERTALTGATGAFDRVVGLDREHPVLLILRVSRGDPPSVRSLAGRSTRCSPSLRKAQYSEAEWLSLPMRLPAAEITYHVPRKPSPLICPGRTSAVSV